MPTNTATGDKINLGFVIGLPPKKAIEYFQKKGNALTQNWYDLWQKEHNQAFTVAKVASMDVLQDIRDMVQKSISEGTTFHQFQKELQPKLKKAGWWGTTTDENGKEIQLGSPWRLRTIYQTNLRTSYQAGRYQQMMDNVGSRPFWQYWAVEDSRTRPEHRILNGKVFRYDDPFWKAFYPPNGFNCRCRVRALSERDMERKGLKVESSEGMLSEENKLVSEKTGEMRPVTVYKNPAIRNLATGKIIEISPDVGWSYNPGETSWEPDLSKYPNDLVAYYNKDKELSQRSKIKISNIPEWQETSDNEVAYQNSLLFKNYTVEKMGEDYNRQIEQDYLLEKTVNDFRENFKKYEGQYPDEDVTGYCSFKGNAIGIHPNEVIMAGKGGLSSCMTFVHENEHAIGRNNFGGNVFLEEKIAELNTVIWTNDNFEDVKPEDLIDYLSKGSIDIFLLMANRYKGNKDEIIKKIKEARVMHPIVAKAFAKNLKKLTDEEFAEELKKLKKYDILKKEDIDNFLNKTEDEKQNVKDLLLLWALKVN
jgi:SPP1 gp7 family putative phage head morphogenesis protein